MAQLISNLTSQLPDWTIPWAGIGALLAGTGSFLTGFAALKASRKQGNGHEAETKKADTSDSSTD